MLRYRALLVTALVLLANGQADAASLVPAGLWENNQEGLVIRIERCGSGLCGFVTGITASDRQLEREEICGAQILKDLRWNANRATWEGLMLMLHGGSRQMMNSTLTSDGKSYLTVRASMGFHSRTLSFVPHKGEIGKDCRSEN